jgi:ribonuclease VapC
LKKTSVLVDKPGIVLDASALLALLRGETGADKVNAALSGTAAINAINWAEVLSTLADLGDPPDEVCARLTDSGVLGQTLLLWPADEALAVEIARLRTTTRPFGLSLGDRACLALALQLNLPVLTADRIWTKVKCGVSVQLIR